MRRNIPTLTLNYLAGGTISRYRIVKFSAANTVVQAAAASDLLLGVTGQGDSSDPSMVASGQRVDVHVNGNVLVEYGGTVTRGQPLTADSLGRAVSASTGNRVIGIATVSGVTGDIGSLIISPSVH